MGNRLLNTVCIALACAAFAEHSNAYNLKDAIRTTLATNPEILASKANKIATEQTVTQARARYFPTIDISASTGNERTRQDLNPNALNVGRIRAGVDTGRHESSVRVSQLIFDGFETPHQIERAKRETYQSLIRVGESQVLVAYSAIEQYITVRRFQRLHALALKNIANHKSILNKVKSLHAAGKASISDKQNVESRLNDAIAAASDLEGDLNSAIASYIEVIGEPPKRLESGAVDMDSLPKTVENALAIARKFNPSLNLARASVDVAQSEHDISKASFWPEFRFEVDARKTFNAGANSGREGNYNALLVMRYNLFNGGADWGRRKELYHRIAESKHRMQAEQRVAEREVRVSWAEMISARKQAKSLRAAVKSKNDVLSTYTVQFDLAQRSFLDILDATHEFFLAKGSLITADATEDLAAYRLLAAMGTVLENINSQNEKNTSQIKHSHHTNKGNLNHAQSKHSWHSQSVNNQNDLKDSPNSRYVKSNQAPKKSATKETYSRAQNSRRKTTMNLQKGAYKPSPKTDKTVRNASLQAKQYADSSPFRHYPHEKEYQEGLKQNAHKATKAKKIINAKMLHAKSSDFNTQMLKKMQQANTQQPAKSTQELAKQSNWNSVVKQAVSTAHKKKNNTSLRKELAQIKKTGPSTLT